MSTVIGVFDNQRNAENAVDEIRDAGITDDNISIIAKEDQIQHEGGRGNNDDLADGAATGGAIGGLAGILAGAGALTIPGVGPIIAAGPLAAGLTGIAAGGLAGTLVDMGIDEERGQHYEKEVEQGNILATVEVNQGQADDVASYLRSNGAREVETH